MLTPSRDYKRYTIGEMSWHGIWQIQHAESWRQELGDANHPPQCLVTPGAREFGYGVIEIAAALDGEVLVAGAAVVEMATVNNSGPIRHAEFVNDR